MLKSTGQERLSIIRKDACISLGRGNRIDFVSGLGMSGIGMGGLSCRGIMLGESTGGHDWNCGHLGSDVET